MGANRHMHLMGAHSIQGMIRDRHVPLKIPVPKKSGMFGIMASVEQQMQEALRQNYEIVQVPNTLDNATMLGAQTLAEREAAARRAYHESLERLPSFVYGSYSVRIEKRTLPPEPEPEVEAPKVIEVEAPKVIERGRRRVQIT